MIFWNPKKKRTTAKPKTTASISKTKVGSVKQELNVPPQPKKTDIPKPNKIPKKEDVKKQFLKTFNQLTYRPVMGCMAGFHYNVCLFFIEPSG